MVTPVLEQRTAGPKPSQGSRWARWVLRVGASALVVMAAVLTFYDIGRIVWAIENWNNSGWEFLPQFEVFLGLTAILPIAAMTLGLATVAYRGTGWWAITSLVAGGLLALLISAWLRGNSSDAHQVFLVIGAIAILSAMPRLVEQTWRVIHVHARSDR